MVIKISTSKYKALCQITKDVAQVFFASIVVPPLLSGFEKGGVGAIVFIAGAITTLMFWYFSLAFAEKGKL